MKEKEKDSRMPAFICSASQLQVQHDQLPAVSTPLASPLTSEICPLGRFHHALCCSNEKGRKVTHLPVSQDPERSKEVGTSFQHL